MCRVAGDHANLEWLGPIDWSEDEQELARRIQAEARFEPKGLDASIQPVDDHPGEPGDGSTDVSVMQRLLVFRLARAARASP